jgi:LysM repeat protein
MAARSPARFLAPIALVAFAFALYSVVQDARDRTDGGASSANPPAQTAPAKSTKKSRAAKKKAAARRKHKTYTVKSGDTPSSIAVKFGITVQELEKLNPDLDPQALTVGERLKLRK